MGGGSSIGAAVTSLDEGVGAGMAGGAFAGVCASYPGPSAGTPPGRNGSYGAVNGEGEGEGADSGLTIGKGSTGAGSGASTIGLVGTGSTAGVFVALW